MYKILGGDGNEYGPVSADTLRQWVREGRANALTQVKVEGAANWQALSSITELADVFSAASGAPPTIGAFPAGGTTATPGATHEGDYELDVFGCVRRSFRVLMDNKGAVLGATLIYIGILMVLGVLGFIPLIGMLFSLASWVIGGPLMGGLYYVLLRAGRNESPSATDLIAGAQKSFLHLFLGQLVPGLFALLCLLPAIVVGGIALISTIGKQHPEPPIAILVVAGGLALLALPVLMWLTTNWMFTLPLVVDRNLDFWTAMKTSWRQVSRHWWTVFGLLLVMGAIGLAFGIVLSGLIMLDIFVIPTLVLKILFGALLALFYIAGVVLLMPVNMGAIAQAYETIFTPRNAQSRQGA